jgi:hypothetical protein
MPDTMVPTQTFYFLQVGYQSTDSTPYVLSIVPTLESLFGIRPIMELGGGMSCCTTWSGQIADGIGNSIPPTSEMWLQ